MEVLARLGVAILELLEAEGRALQRSFLRLIAVIAIGVVLLVLSLAGLGFLLYGLDLFYAQWFSPAESALLVGVTAWLFVVVGLLAIRGILGGPPYAGQDND
jgi:hypothetical protein